MKVTKERKKELIKVKLATILQKSSNNPMFEGVTLVDVKLSPDSSTALILFSVFGRDNTVEIAEALNKASGYFQSKLRNSLQTKNTPKLKFVFDNGFDHASKIDSILKNLDIPEE